MPQHPDFQRAYEIYRRLELHLRSMGLKAGEDQRIDPNCVDEAGVVLGYWLASGQLELSWQIRQGEDGSLSVVLELAHCSEPQEQLYISCGVKTVGDKDYWIFAGADETGGLDYQLLYFQEIVEKCGGGIPNGFDEEVAFGWIDILAKAFNDY